MTFDHCRLAAPDAPLVFCESDPALRFEAFVDVKQEMGPVDLLSQINTLQQVENMASHDLFRSRMLNGEIQTHALWFDVHTAEVYYYDRWHEKRFVEIRIETVDRLMKAAKSQWS